MKFTKEDYDEIAAFAFSSENPGYKPQVIESPNGDGIWDAQKKYAHIAPKYLNQTNNESMWFFYNMAKVAAFQVCEELGIPKEFYPGEDSTLRILDYPPGATTAPHTDFDLFTLCMYRDDYDAFKYLSGENDLLLMKARSISQGIHFGEILTEVNGAQATGHEVVGTEKRQCSIVFFVVPDHKAVLPSGLTVGEWMEERKNRSRKTVQ